MSNIRRILTDKQRKVVETAERKLKKESWYHGVCLDNLMVDSKINNDTFDEAVRLLVDDTIYFDG